MGKSKDLATGETRFVNTAGDTMTGALSISSQNSKLSASSNHLILHDTAETDTGSNWWYMYRNSGDGALRFYKGADRLKIDSSGAVTTPYQPYVHYTTLDTTTHTGTTIVPRWQSAKATRGTNGYNTSTGTYTAPFTGVYCCEWAYLYMNISGTANIDDGYNHNGTHYYSGNRFNAGDYSFGDNYTAVQGGVNIYLAANDTFSPQTLMTGDTSWNFYGNNQWGYLTIAFIG